MKVTAIRIIKVIVQPNGSKNGAEIEAIVDEGDESWERVAERLHLRVDAQIYRGADADRERSRLLIEEATLYLSAADGAGPT